MIDFDRDCRMDQGRDTCEQKSPCSGTLKLMRGGGGEKRQLRQSAPSLLLWPLAIYFSARPLARFFCFVCPSAYRVAYHAAAGTRYVRG